MLKRILNECRFNLSIQTKGPVLVKSGHATVSGPDMAPVKTYRNGREEVFLPGSSLKGVFRSHLEKVMRTINAGVVCNPFAKTELQIENGRLICPGYPEVACSDKFEGRQKEEWESEKPQRTKWKNLNVENLSNEQIYQDSCLVCRLFGSTFFIGRVAISDAYLGKNTVERTEQRDGVGIDRLTGGASSGAKFELEVVSPDVTFETNIHLRNFEVWQLGMLMLVAQDLEDSLIRIGSGRSRGLGVIKGEISEVCVSYIGAVNGKAANEVWGLGKFLGDSSYGTSPNDHLTLQHAPAEDTKGIRKIAIFNGDSLEELKEETITHFVETVQNWTMPAEMQFEHLQFERMGD